MKDKDSPAFPVVSGTPTNIHINDDQKGLTKREYIATRTLQGLLSADKTIKPDDAVKQAIQIADSILDQL